MGAQESVRFKKVIHDQTRVPLLCTVFVDLGEEMARNFPPKDETIKISKMEMDVQALAQSSLVSNAQEDHSLEEVPVQKNEETE